MEKLDDIPGGRPSAEPNYVVHCGLTDRRPTSPDHEEDEATNVGAESPVNDSVDSVRLGLVENENFQAHRLSAPSSSSSVADVGTVDVLTQNSAPEDGQEEETACFSSTVPKRKRVSGVADPRLRAKMAKKTKMKEMLSLVAECFGDNQNSGEEKKFCEEQKKIRVEQQQWESSWKDMFAMQDEAFNSTMQSIGRILQNVSIAPSSFSQSQHHNQAFGHGSSFSSGVVTPFRPQAASTFRPQAASTFSHPSGSGFHYFNNSTDPTADRRFTQL